MKRVPVADGFESEVGRVTRRLRDDILDGVLEQGGPLVERELADQLGTSRVPVRDALLALAGEGLVTRRPRSWSRVREFSNGDIADLQEVRAALEVLAFNLLAQHHTPAVVTRMRSLVERELAAAVEGNVVEARHAAADFHEAVLDLADNGLLRELGAVLASRMRWLLGRYDDLERVACEHAAILDALVAGDINKVGVLVRSHMETGRYLDGLSGPDDRASQGGSGGRRARRRRPVQA